MPMYGQMIELLLLSEHLFLGKDASLRIGGSASARRCGRIVMKTNSTSRHRHHVLCRSCRRRSWTRRAVRRLTPRSTTLGL